MVLGGGRVMGCGMAAGWGLGRAASAGVARVYCRPCLPVAGFWAPGALAVARAPAVRRGSEARVDDVSRSIQAGVLDEGVVLTVVVELDEVVVVLEVVESVVEETDLGDCGGCRAELEVEEMDVGDSGWS